jgi:glycine/D-amino acid oxidase-like deaminating enzyme
MDDASARSNASRFVIIGAGFAGASTAWALARLGEGPGVILERESAVGVHASGRNAGLLKISEDDEVVRALAIRTSERLKPIESVEPNLIHRAGGLTLWPSDRSAAPDELDQHLRHDGVPTERWSPAKARERFPLLRHVVFGTALWCPAEGVVDVHALLTHYLRGARAGGFTLRTGCGVEDLIVEAGRVVGVETSAGPIRADVVIDATGAWAGRLGRAGRHLPLQPVRRHLFVSGPVEGVTRELPFVWVEGAEFYFRSEGDGLLLSPCDQTPSEPGTPSTDPAAAELLADKLSRHAPGLGNLSLRKAWACLRTFAPDRRPIIGNDPDLPGLFHVSGLGGFGVMTSAAVGELAALLLVGRTADWIDPAAVRPGRHA